ncbi:MAG: D-arabinono-1,4-lactone oxidase [Bdellovibrionota bacterium]
MAHFNRLIALFFVCWGSSNSFAYESCKGFYKTLSCGNLVCEPRKKETAENCPIDCETFELRSYNSQAYCSQNAEFRSPKNLEEAVDDILMAQSLGRSIRVVGAMHSQTDVFCGNEVMLSTAKLNAILGLREFAGDQVVDVQPGVKLGDLQDWLHEKNLTLGLAVPNYPHITMAGGLATGSHGTSRLHPATLASAVREIEWVTADGRVFRVNHQTPNTTLWNAARVSLGSLGFITKLSLKVEPQFHLNITTTAIKDDVLLRRYPHDWPQPCDSETYFWFPSQGKALRFCGTRTSAPVDPNGMNTILLQRGPESKVQEALRKVMHFSRCSPEVACSAEWMVFRELSKSPPFKKENRKGKLVSSSSVTGHSHKMTTSHFPDPDQKFYSVIDWALAIPAFNVGSALNYVKTYSKKHKVCFPVGGITLRFVHDDRASLGFYNFASGDAEDPAVVFEFVTYDPQGVSGADRTRMNQPIYELVHNLMSRFGARPHWGKNENWVLKEAVRLGNYEYKLDDFLETKTMLDPSDQFGNELTRSLFGNEGITQ